LKIKLYLETSEVSNVNVRCARHSFVAEFCGKEKNFEIHPVTSFLIDCNKKRETLEGFPCSSIKQIGVDF